MPWPPCRHKSLSVGCCEIKRRGACGVLKFVREARRRAYPAGWAGLKIMSLIPTLIHCTIKYCCVKCSPPLKNFLPTARCGPLGTRSRVPFTRIPTSCVGYSRNVCGLSVTKTAPAGVKVFRKKKQGRQTINCITPKNVTPCKTRRQHGSRICPSIPLLNKNPYLCKKVLP